MKQSDKERTFSTTGVPLAIIGIGCLFPKSEDKTAFWATIREGVDTITEIPDTHWQTDQLYDPDPKTADKSYGKRGGFLGQTMFNPMEFNIPPNSLEAIDTSQLLGLVAAGQALKDAGYGPDSQFDRSRVSVILGVTGALEMVIPLGARLGHPRWREALRDAGVPEQQAEDVVQRISESYVGWQENSFPGLLGNVVAGRISKHYDLGGTNCVVDAACASSFSALHLAAMELATGAADMVISGGVDTFNDIFMYTCFSKTPALSASGDARPFDTGADGTILGEGLGLVVLKRLADAERDGDRIYAVIRGIGSSSDGKGEAIYTPCPKGQQKAVRTACKNAGVSLESITLLEAHGTGTRVGDAVEVSAARELFGEADRPFCAISSVKSQIGHAKAAAGSAGLIKAALSLYHRTIPPTIKVTRPLPEVTSGNTPFYITTKKRPWISNSPRRAGISAFGFGGSNFHTILEEYRPLNERVDWDGSVQIIPFSGDDAAAIKGQLDRFEAAADWQSIRTSAQKLRGEFRHSANCRLFLVLDRNSNIANLITNAGKMLEKQPQSSWSTPDGIFYGYGNSSGKLALLFPGQGAQYIGMLRDLACSFPQMISALEQGEEVTCNLSDTIYPPDSFDAETDKEQMQRLQDTAMAQPAIGAVSFGALQLLRQFGLKGDGAAGHSYGELTALCAAGTLDEESFHRLSRLRGQCMNSGDGDKGTMLAVSADLAQVERLLAEEQLQLVIANRNAPNQAVLSGSKEQIALAEAACKKRNLTCKQLQVAAAFHSPLVADAAVPFYAALKELDFGAGIMPVYSNSTTLPYPTDSNEAKQLLANQLARPVEFVSQIENMYADGFRTFLEIGPGARLSGLVKEILNGQEHCCIPLDSSNGKRNGMVDLARFISQLAATGYELDLSRWDEGYQPPVESAKKPLLLVPISGANYIKPKPKRPAVKQIEVKAEVKKELKDEVESETYPVREAQKSAEQKSRSATVVRTSSLQIASDSIAALQKMQEDTARLHQRFLEGQELAARTIQAMLTMPGQSAGTMLTGTGHPAILPHPVHPPLQPQPTMPEMQAAEQLSDAPVIGADQMGVLNSLEDIAAYPQGYGSGVKGQEKGAVSDATLPSVVETLLSIISQKTGYPVDMLELSMSMDADLGIDSIKRVEILSALQEQLPDAPVIGADQMGVLNSLEDIATYLQGSGSGVKDQEKGAASDATLPPVVETLLSIISQKTGYPVDMLELSMSMDADLGIDSIKRVEILSALQEQLPDAPVIGADQMGVLNSLEDIATYLQGSGSGSGVKGQEKGAASDATLPPVVETLLSIISQKTGYPVDMLELSMSMDADLGIDSIKRVEILSALQEQLPDAPVIGPEQLGQLNRLGEIADYLSQGDSEGLKLQNRMNNVVEGLSDAALPQSPTSPTVPLYRSILLPQQLLETGQQIQLAKDGLIVVTDDGSSFSTELCSALSALGYRVTMTKVLDLLELLPLDQVSALILIPPADGTTDSFLKNGFLLLKQLAPGLKRASREGGALFATVSRLDGAFGCNPGSTITDPLSGGLAGMSKTAQHEWPEVNCKAIDLGHFNSPERSVNALVKELFLAGPMEVGLSEGGRTGLYLQDQEVTRGDIPPVRPGELVIITGGGRGVTAAAAVAMAKAWQPLLVLLGRSPLPQQEPDWLSGLTEEGEIKRAILEHSREKLHPREIEERYQATISGRELRRTMTDIQAAGGMPLYFAVDIRDAALVSGLITKLHEEHGPVRGIIHGAGVLADRLIVDKTAQQFNQVYSTKVAGLDSLLAAVTDDELRFLALFGSSTGRFGRSGQLDYAVANELMNKLAQAESRKRTDCRTVCINWGPWDGGMVTPALKKLFTTEGIGLIPLEAGAELLVSELGNPAGGVELTVMAGISAAELLPAQPVRQLAQLKEALRLTLNVSDFPFINSHVIDNRAVLPMAMIMEWLAHAALHGNPGFCFHGFNDLRICKGVIIDRHSSSRLILMAGKANHQDAFYHIPVELVSQQGDGATTLHARAEVLLANRLPEGIRTIKEISNQPYQQGGAVYEQPYLFHGPDLQGIELVTSCSENGISAQVRAASAPAGWIKSPLRSGWLTDPLVMDSAFQMMILWSFERFGAGSLPTFAARYRQFHERFPKDGAQINIKVRSAREHNAVADIEFLERGSGKLIARMEGYECVIDRSLAQAFRRNQLLQDSDSDAAAA